MIRDLGNCGHFSKLERILNAWQSAKDNQCSVVIVLDELCYGKAGVYRFTPQEVYDITISGNQHDLLLTNGLDLVAKYPWWDITKVNVLW